MKVGRAEVGPGQPLLSSRTVRDRSEAQTLAAARKVADVAQRHGLPAVFKCSFDKANRTAERASAALAQAGVRVRHA